MVGKRNSPNQQRRDTSHRAKPDAKRMRRLIRGAHRRLQGVHVECLDWADFIRRYDRPFTLFYIDPPYWGHEADYGKGLFPREDFARMAELLRELRGSFLLSLGDRPEVRELFSRFEIEEVTTRYSANAKSTRHVSELLITGESARRKEKESTTQRPCNRPVLGNADPLINP